MNLISQGLILVLMLTDASAAEAVKVTWIRGDSGPARAGIVAGDVITHWELMGDGAEAQEQGSFPSPFDWNLLMTNTAPKGEIGLSVERDGKHLHFKVPVGLWRMRVRAVFPQELEALYDRGAHLFREKKPEEAAAVWEELAQKCKGLNAAWVYTHLADQLSRSLGWGHAEAAFEKALALSEGRDEIQILILQDMGLMYLNHGMYDQAHAWFKEALSRCHGEWKNSLLEASVQYRIGGVYTDLEKQEMAELHLRKALEIREKLAPGCLEIGHTYNSLGLVTELRGNYEEARTLLVKAVEIQASLAPGSMGVAMFNTNLGGLLHRRSQYEEASAYYGEAIRILKTVAPKSPYMAIALGNLGNVLVSTGHFDKAQANLEKALGLHLQLEPVSLNTANTRVNLGDLYLKRGFFEKAEAQFWEALQLTRKMAPNTRKLCASLRSLGKLAILQGDYQTADDYLKEAYAIAEGLNSDGLEEGVTLTYLGISAQEQDQIVDAKAYFEKALAFLRKVPGQSSSEAGILNRMGRMALDKNQYDEAWSLFTQALEIQERLAPQSFSMSGPLDSLGMVALAQNKTQEAERFFKLSLKFRQKLAPNSFEAAAGLYGLASTYAKQGRYSEAVNYFKQALDSLETQVGRLGGSLDMKALFRARHENIRHHYLSLLLSQGSGEEAYLALEQSRARTFLEMMAERDIAFSSEDAPQKLVEERRRLSYMYEKTQSRLWELDGSENPNEIETLQKELSEYRREYNRVGKLITQASPRLGSLLYPKPLSFQQTRDVLEKGDLLLSYFVTPEKTWIFVVEPGRPLEVVEISAGEEQLKAHAVDLRSLLASPPTNSPLARRILDRQIQDLFKLLVAPVSPQLQRAKKLIVVGDGPLLTLPFHLLKGALQEGAPEKYLIEQLAISQVVSATVYAELQENRPSASSNFQIAAFGDPKYPWTSRTTGADLTRDQGDLRAILKVRDLKPLPYTAMEVKAIAELYGEQARIFLGDQATEEHAKNLSRDTRIVHFAGHGFFNPKTPLDSSLLLTIPESLKPGAENGVLQAWEIIESMRLDSDLVVLSACETGLGEELGGEGLIGLTRAFQYAGARAVLASLWTVSDAATSELMKQFYTSLKKGYSQDEALRRAQVALISGPIAVETENGKVDVDFSHPYYWAAFQLMGNPR